MTPNEPVVGSGTGPETCSSSPTQSLRACKQASTACRVRLGSFAPSNPGSVSAQLWDPDGHVDGVPTSAPSPWFSNTTWTHLKPLSDGKLTGPCIQGAVDKSTQADSAISKLAPMGAAAASLFTRSPCNPIVTASMLPCDANTVFNPAAVEIDGETVLLVRVEDRRGISHLQVARSADGVTGWQFPHTPAFPPDAHTYPEEVWGIEDPRATWLAERGEWVIAYTAFSRRG